MARNAACTSPPSACSTVRITRPHLVRVRIATWLTPMVSRPALGVRLTWLCTRALGWLPSASRLLREPSVINSPVSGSGSRCTLLWVRM